MDYREDFANILDQLSTYTGKRGDYIRSKIFKRAYENLTMYSDTIKTKEDLNNIPGIGPGIVRLFIEFVDTGKVELLIKEQNRMENVFSDIYGVGPKKAKELVDKGIRTLDELRDKQDVLNDIQKVGLKYYDDILKRIPRSEIDKYLELFTEKMDLVKDETTKFEIVGSYRRGKKESGDIDVIVTSDTREVFKNFVSKLILDGVIIEVLSRGPSKSLVIGRLNDKSIPRRIDFLYSPPEEYAFATLYFTGSKMFNTVMRSHALTMSLSLNEHGLYKKEKGQKKEDKLTQVFNSEQEIFDFLKLTYREPLDRIDGMSVVKQDGSRVLQKTNKTLKSEKKKIPKNKTIKQKIEKKLIDPELAVYIKMKIGELRKELASLMNMKEKDLKHMKSKEEIGKMILEKKKEIQESVIEEPQEPLKEEPEMPELEEPQEPLKEEPEMPVLEEPQEPLKEEPEMPELEEPQEPLKEEPEMPVLEEPQEPVLEEQEMPEPQEPVLEESEMPVLEEPSQKPDVPKKKSTPKKSPRPKNKTLKKIKTKSENNIMNKETTMQHMENFKNQGMTYLKTLKEKDVANMIILANEQFHSYDDSKVVSLTDNEYDIVKEFLEKKNPKNKALKEVGAPIEKNKVELPVNMPSMDKIKPDSNALSNWQLKYTGPYVLSCKLDGVSGLYYSMDGKRKLYTRGNGKVGQDISHLLKDIAIPDVKDVIVRGEFIIKRNVFESKYKDTFANPRNLVAGIINRKSKDSKSKDVDFIAYEVIEPVQKPSSQMASIESMGFKTVKNENKKTVSNNYLSDVLMDWRTNYEYEIDGIIVSDDNVHPRVEGNPDHSFAFKMVMSDQVTEAKVVDVLWKPSKDGYLKPRVRIEPVHIGGVKIEYATGFNGNFVETNKIGIGAVVQLIRSGDVIPHIKGVTTPAEKAKMPDVEYSWTETHVDIIMANKDQDPEVLSKNITLFFTSLGVDGLSIGNVKKIIKAGYNTICKFLEMSEEDFLKIDGFKEKMAKKLKENIASSVEKATLLKIMAASGKFGRGIGERKIRPIMDAYPDILSRNETNAEKIEMLKGITGIGKENSKSFVENISEFLEFMRQCKLTHKYDEKEDKTPKISVNESHPLFNKKIVMTKIRDKDIIEKLASYGAALVDSVKKDVFVVITKDKEDTSSKLEKARTMNISIMTPEEFKSSYFA